MENKHHKIKHKIKSALENLGVTAGEFLDEYRESTPEDKKEMFKSLMYFHKKKKKSKNQ